MEKKKAVALKEFECFPQGLVLPACLHFESVPNPEELERRAESLSRYYRNYAPRYRAKGRGRRKDNHFAPD